LSVLPVLELTLAEASRERLTLAVILNGRPAAVLRLKRGKQRLTVYLSLDGSGVEKLQCKARGTPPNCLARVASLLAERIGLPGVAAQLAKELENAYSRWGDIAEAEELRRLRSQLEQYGTPIMRIEREGRIIEVLASNGVEMPAYGGYIELGDCAAVAETTYAYVQEQSPDGVRRRIELIGALATYKREGDFFTLQGVEPFLPYATEEVTVCERPVHLKRPAAKLYQESASSSTLPSVELLRDASEAKESLGLEEWRRVGRELVARLRDSIYHPDPRVYAVLASYVAMTYFYDVFTAVPFLWFYGPPGSGKTRANMTVTFMSRRGVFIANPSDASLYRLADSLGGAIGVDESALTREQKLILASGYKRTAAVPRVERVGSGFVLKLFHSVAPRVFSFIDLPSEDYLRQRIIAIPMEKGRPARREDPEPSDYVELRERLYRLRLLGLPAVLEAKRLADQLLEDNGVEGRDREVWWPILTAAVLLGLDCEVTEYMLHDIEAKRESEEMYMAERTVLAAIERVLQEATQETLDSGDPVAVFTASDLQRLIVEDRLREEGCLEVAEGEAGEEERVKPECRRRAEELRREWSVQRVGRVLERLGFTKYRRKQGKSGGARRKYELPRGAFEEKARLYGLRGSAESVKSVKCLGDRAQSSSPHREAGSNGEKRDNSITKWFGLEMVPIPRELDRLGRLDRPMKRGGALQ